MGSEQIVDALVAEGVTGAERIAASTLRGWLPTRILRGPKVSGRGRIRLNPPPDTTPCPQQTSSFRMDVAAITQVKRP